MNRTEFETRVAEFNEEFQKKLEHDKVVYATDYQIMLYKHILGIDVTDEMSHRKCYCGWVMPKEEKNE